MNSSCCAVCKILKKACLTGCNTAPHFPSHDTRFEDVHQIFGADNVSKIFDNLGSAEQREIAAFSLCYAAEARRRDSISGSPGMIVHYENIFNNVEQDIKSAVNEVETNMGPDQVPKFVDLPVPGDFLTTPGSLDSYIEKIKSLNTVEKNQLMQLWKGEDQNMGDGHGADGASTSAGPSTALPKKYQ